MEIDPQIIWILLIAIIIAPFVLAIILLFIRINSIAVEVRRSGAAHDSIHLTVKERLDEVSHKVGDGLNQSHATIGEMRERLAIIDEAQKNLSNLSAQVVGLQDIMSNKQARGAFGEIQLKDLVETALPPSAYDFQHTFSNGKRADCLIVLPNPPGPIAIDAKFPLESFHLLRKATSESEHHRASKSFARDLSKHISDVAEKYIIPGETAESALLFLPSEAVYAELHSNFFNTVENSYKQRVWIVSPTTLMATLNTVRAILRDVQMREQAGLIRDEIIRMLEDIKRLDERVSKLSDHFDKADKSIREIRTSSEKIMDRGEKIREVNLSSDKQSGNLANSNENKNPLSIK